MKKKEHMIACKRFVPFSRSTGDPQKDDALWFEKFIQKGKKLHQTFRKELLIGGPCTQECGFRGRELWGQSCLECMPEKRQQTLKDMAACELYLSLNPKRWPLLKTRDERYAKKKTLPLIEAGERFRAKDPSLYDKTQWKPFSEGDDSLSFILSCIVMTVLLIVFLWYILLRFFLL